jgi:signal transduction histidine kinase
MDERLRISRELHDEVGATLSGISMYSHLAIDQIKSFAKLEVVKSLNIIQQSSAEMVNKLNDIVWLINPDQGSLQNLSTGCKNTQ